jgi:hypothetical protein
MMDIRADDLETFTVPTNGLGHARKVCLPADRQAMADLRAAPNHHDMHSSFAG